jgi:hypothetical protein
MIEETMRRLDPAALLGPAAAVAVALAVRASV